MSDTINQENKQDEEKNNANSQRRTRNAKYSNTEP